MNPAAVPTANPAMARAQRHPEAGPSPPIAIPRNATLPLWFAGNTPKRRLKPTASTKPATAASSAATTNAAAAKRVGGGSAGCAPPVTGRQHGTRTQRNRGGALSCLPHADVAQLVEHHLAKVRVAGSNPVVRSKIGSESAGAKVAHDDRA